ncbi:hypothetical protein ACFQHV_05870 [Promicromonospora thailandica]|uniref:Uncharacterized protein n=1 Tax=Promicromonospora thailandica TaxID=765201 RepID=A0A9X2FZP6_9MICO|nr:hypothetical protein [Promicromonospora thailandica]MCP2263345.1 hypothetical protein [Promicromonospora thailandica]BFF19505.1 hypothetical protein GCM10025730_30260 [Promicromonospora thailandica]
MVSDPTAGTPAGAGQDGDGGALDAAETLRLIREQQERARDATGPDGRLLFGAWGLAWLIGYLAMWTTARTAGLPAAWAGWVFAGCIVGAMVFTIVHSVTRTAGVRGVSARIGAMYGWTWFLAFLGLGVLLGAMGRAGAEPEIMAIAANGFAALITGLLYIAGGMLFEEYRMSAVGGWMLVTAVVAAFAGMPHTYLVMALAGGGGFLAMAVVEHVLRRRRRSTSARTEGGVRSA